MQSSPLEFYQPETVDEAIALLTRFGGEAKVLAGGQSLVPLMNLRLAAPQALIHVGHIPELQDIRRAGDALIIGALATHSTIERSALVQGTCPLLTSAAGWIAHRQIRNRGTIGGSLAHADPAAEWPLVVTCVGGSLRLRGPQGERVVPAGEFFLGAYSTALATNELVVAIEIPLPSADHGWSIQEIARRHGDFAIVAAAALITRNPDGTVATARAALSAVGPAPFDATDIASSLCGETPTAERFRAVAAEISAAIDPASDLHASATYRREVAGELAYRALAEAWDRAR